MASANRVTIITEAIFRAGRKSQNISLTASFDAITRDITSRYPILNHVESANNMANGTGYVTLPSDYAFREFMVANGALLEWEEPETFLSYIKINTSNNANPTHHTISKGDSKIYLRPTPNSNSAFSFYYAKIHPASSNDAYVHILGEEFDETIILGVTAKCCQIIQEYERAAYWWHGGKSDEPQAGSYLYDLKIKADARLTRYVGSRVYLNDYPKIEDLKRIRNERKR